MFRKYRLFKRLLLSFLFINISFIAVGLVAGVRYFRETQLRDGEMALIGLMILLFGFVLPLLLLKKIEKEIKDWEFRTQKLISEWIAAWISAQETHGSNEEVIKDFGFWLNIAIIGMQAMQGQMKNPYFQFAAEMASFIKNSLEEQKKTHGTNRKKSKTR